jgi:hypothetical protein
MVLAVEIRIGNLNVIDCTSLDFIVHNSFYLKKKKNNKNLDFNIFRKIKIYQNFGLSEFQHFWIVESKSCL